MTLEATENFGFTRVGQGETLSKNGFAALDGDRTMLDSLLLAIFNHRHEGGERLADPASAPTATVQTDSDGMIGADRTYFYKYAYIDANGLETAPSPEVEITTPPGSGRPSAPALTHLATGGSLNAGKYTYRITYADLKGGESTPSDPVSISFTTDQCAGACRVQLDLPVAPSATPCINIYRAKQGQTRYYFLKKIDVDPGNETIAFDDGTVAEDLSLTPPTANTTASSNEITITINGGVIPEGVIAWRLYRTSTSGSYGNASLVHEVIESTSETAQDLRATWTDVGGMLNAGSPRERSAAIGSSQPLRLEEIQGVFQLASMPRGGQGWDVLMPGDLRSRTYARSAFALDVRPWSMSAFFRRPNSGLVAPIRFFVRDSLGGQVELVAATDGDYYAIQFPTTESGFAEAEDGGTSTRSASVPIVTDLDASGIEAVEIAASGEFSLAEFGPLDAGEYRAFVAMRALDDSITDDIRLSVRRVSDDAQLFSQVLTISDTTYQEYELGPFAVGQGESVYVRVDKLLEAQVVFYRVDYFRFEATLASLQAGPLDVVVEVEGFAFEGAETGALTGTAAVITDPGTETGSAVELVADLDRVDINVGALPVLLTDARVRVRTVNGTAPADGLRLEARRADTQGVLSTVLVSPSATEYGWFSLDPFTPPTGVDMILRVEKVTATDQYVVDHVETSLDGMDPGGDVQFRLAY